MATIASLDTASNGIDTIAKFVRLVGNEGVTMQQFRLPIDDQTARRNLAAFFKNGCNFIVKGPGVLIVDRTKSFDPVKVIGLGWSVVESDSRNTGLTEVDFSKVRFESGLKEDETNIDGRTKLERLKAMSEIRLDAHVGQTLYEEKGQATLRFLYETYGITWFEMAGTVLHDSDNIRCFLCLYHGGDGPWRRDFRRLIYGRCSSNVSPLLSS